MIGPGRAIDTDRFFVMCVNSLGSCFGSTGPASINPATGKPYRLDFPGAVRRGHRARRLRSRALAGHRAARHGHGLLAGRHGGGGIRRRGPGWRATPGQHLRLLGRSSPFAIALRSVQREAMMSDPAWNGGQYADNERGPQSGMRIARKLGTITYRSADEWRGRFARSGLTPVGKQAVARALKRVPEGFGPRFAVETYLEVTGRAVRARVRSELLPVSVARHGLLRHRRAWRCRRSLPSRRDSPARWSSAWNRTSCSPSRSRRRSPRTSTAAGVPTTFARLPSIEGHDAFLVDLPRFDAAIRGFLNA